MKLFLILGLGAAVLAAAQNKLPADIHAETLTRLPAVERGDLDEEGRKIFDSLAGANTNRPLRGILGLGIYNPELARSLHLLHDSLTKDGTLGNHVTELAILVATREQDMSMNEWYPHEAAALKAGVSQATIEIVKRGQEAGAIDADALVIRFGHELFRQKHVSSETFAKAVEAFGRRGTVELIGLMSDYAMVGTMLQAVDQQLPGKPPLPPLSH